MPRTIARLHFREVAEAIALLNPASEGGADGVLDRMEGEARRLTRSRKLGSISLLGFRLYRFDDGDRLVLLATIEPEMITRPMPGAMLDAPAEPGDSAGI